MAQRPRYLRSMEGSASSPLAEGVFGRRTFSSLMLAFEASDIAAVLLALYFAFADSAYVMDVHRPSNCEHRQDTGLYTWTTINTLAPLLGLL